MRGSADAHDAGPTRSPAYPAFDLAVVVTLLLVIPAGWAIAKQDWDILLVYASLIGFAWPVALFVGRRSKITFGRYLSSTVSKRDR